jgi:glutamyl-tRNA synthetase
MKTRFCPSPSGDLHIGNMRTALFNYLYAKNKRGTFLLRIEDTDLSRSKDSFINSIQKDLLALNLKWDEGISIGDQNTLYKQSERIEIYQKYYGILLEKKQAYYCFCSEEELKVSRKLQASQGLPPKYNGKCRELSEDEIQENIASGKQAAIRFLIPRNLDIEFNDSVRGKQSFASNTLGDFIIKKTDGMASFMFANAVDDALMGVTHVLRGEDHLTNTPRQLLVLEALELPAPQYVHMSIIVGKDRQPLSKRNGSQSITNLLNAGYLSIAVLNYLARIGHYYKDNNLLSFTELIDRFSVGNLVKSAAVFDLEQLNSWQKQAVLNCTSEEFESLFLKDSTFNISNEQHVILVNTLKNNVILPSDVDEWISVFFSEKLDYSPENMQLIKKPGKEFFLIWLSLLEKNNNIIKDLYGAINSKLALKGKQVYMPIRVLLTNKTSGAELQNIADIVGINLLKQRVKNIIENFR